MKTIQDNKKSRIDLWIGCSISNCQNQTKTEFFMPSAVTCCFSQKMQSKQFCLSNAVFFSKDYDLIEQKAHCMSSVYLFRNQSLLRLTPQTRPIPATRISFHGTTALGSLFVHFRHSTPSAAEHLRISSRVAEMRYLTRRQRWVACDFYRKASVWMQVVDTVRFVLGLALLRAFTCLFLS